MPRKIRANSRCPQCGGPKYPHSKTCRLCFVGSNAPRKKSADFSACPDCGKPKHPSAELCRPCRHKANPRTYRRDSTTCPQCGGNKYPESEMCGKCRQGRSSHVPVQSTKDGLCRCGCGATTSIVRISRPQRGLVAGQFAPYLRGHKNRKQGDGPNPSGLCMCGCGQASPIAKKAVNGQVIGKPVRFIRGHATRESHADYIVIPATGCWEWQLYKNKKGYGRTGRGGRSQGAHRYYYELSRGPIPDALEIHHLCRNPSCVNPDHLEAVTRAEHIRISREQRKQSAH